MGFNRIVRAVGPKPARGMVIGYAPGESEMRVGKPFVGVLGKMIRAFISRTGLNPNDLYWTNLYKLPYAMVAKDERAKYAELLIAEIEEVQPNAIALVGHEMTQHFLGDVNLEAVHGLEAPHDHVMGGWLVPCYWPASGNEPHSWFDFKRFAQLVRKPNFGGTLRSEAGPGVYKLAHPAHCKFEAEEVAIDTEGFPDRPWCLSFSIKIGTGFVVLAGDVKCLDAFQKSVAKCKRVIIHNLMYDLAMLRAMGIEIRPDQIVDTMVMAYELQIEPQGLKPLSYRHLGLKMRSYDDVTEPYDRRIALRYLRPIAKIEWPKPDKEIVVDKVGKASVKQPQPLHTRVRKIVVDAANPATNPRKRWMDVTPAVRKPAEDQFGPMPEFSFDAMPLGEAIQYAGGDADAPLRLCPILEVMIEEQELVDVLKMDMAVIPLADRMQAVGMPVSRKRLEDLEVYFTDAMRRKMLEIKLLIGRKVNPDSPVQVSQLLFGELGLPSPKLTKKGAESTNDKVLQELLPMHPVVPMISDYRGMSKNRDSFAVTLQDQIRNDRIHGNIRVTRTTSGRLSMTDPNMQAIPTRDEESRRIRAAFVAPKGRLLASCDLDQIEMRVMADESHDEALVRLFRTGQDVHTDLAAEIFGVPKDQAKETKYRYPAKRIGFGIMTGISAKGLLDQMYLAGIYMYKLDDCERWISEYYRIRKGVARYIRDCRAEARRLGFVKDRWGRRRDLPAILSPVTWVSAEAERQSHSHKIQGGAQGFIKRAMVRLDKRAAAARKAGIYWEFLLQIHDEMISEHDAEADPLVEATMLSEMTADTKLMCVPIKAKYGSGPDWGSLKD